MEQSSGVGIASSREQNAFWQFSDQLRLQTSGLSSLSLGDSIWSDAYLRRSEGRRNLDGNGGGSGYQPPADLGWKMGGGGLLGGQKLAFGGATGHPVNRYNNNNADEKSGDLKSGKYFQTNSNTSGRYNNYNDNFQINSNTSGSYNNYNGNGDVKNYFNKAINKPVNGNSNHGGKKKNTNSGTGDKNKSRNNNNNNNNSGGAMDKRFKTLPPSEALPRNEAIGGYIFVCNNDTMEENLKRQLFGLPSRYRDSVRAITPGLPLFLYNYSTHQLHGVFEATSFGGTNIDPTAWEDKKCPGESRFPAQVKVMTRRICEPLEEDAFRPILHHYDGPKFRLELNVEEAIQVLDKFAEN